MNIRQHVSFSWYKFLQAIVSFSWYNGQHKVPTFLWAIWCCLQLFYHHVINILHIFCLQNSFGVWRVKAYGSCVNSKAGTFLFAHARWLPHFGTCYILRKHRRFIRMIHHELLCGWLALEWFFCIFGWEKQVYEVHGIIMTPVYGEMLPNFFHIFINNHQQKYESPYRVMTLDINIYKCKY